jgi:hypothetical protein
MADRRDVAGFGGGGGVGDVVVRAGAPARRNTPSRNVGRLRARLGVGARHGAGAAQFGGGVSGHYQHQPARAGCRP